MGLATLAQVLRPLHETFAETDHPALLVGLDAPDDAAVYQVSPDLALIETLDFFPPVVDDPYTYGAIAAANAMSDVYAMGGEVALALNIAGFPGDLDPGILAEVFRGGAEKVREAGAVIAGGHTIIDAEPKYGLAVTGVIHPAAIIRTGGARPGDALLLTKPIGTGILLTAAQQDLPNSAAGLAVAIDSMLALNRHSAHLARSATVHAMTDVTGFSLLGHSWEIASQSGVRLVLSRPDVPLLPGAREFAQAGIGTGGGQRNREQLGPHVAMPEGTPAADRELLFDPQTSGGLLISIGAEGAEALRSRIEAESGGCWRVGWIEAGPPLVAVRG